MKKFLRPGKAQALCLVIAMVTALVGLAAFNPDVAQASTTSVTSTNTAFVDQFNPTTNQGTNTQLEVMGQSNKNKVAYLEFVVSGIPAGSAVNGAALNLFTRSTSKAGIVEARSVATGWTENTLTWNNRPTPSTTIMSNVNAPVNAGFSMNVSNVTGNGTYRYALTAPPGQKQLVVLPSDDYTSNTAERPALTVNYTTAGAVPPTVTTGAASSITSNSATLNGTVNPNGASTTCHFDYGTDGTVTIPTSNDTSPGSGTSSVAVTANISNLSPSTTYFFRLSCSNSGGVTNGTNASFDTAAPPATVPEVVTGAATNLATTTATLNGTADPNGAATTCHFEYGQDQTYGTSTANDSSPGSGSSPVAVTANITSLSASTLYHAKLVCSNSAGTTHGNDVTFQTLNPPVPPSVTTGAATAVTATAAVLNGTAIGNGSTTTCHFDYGTSTSYGSTTPNDGTAGDGSDGPVEINAPLSGLPASTLHHFRLSCTNSGGTVNGADATFTTTAAPTFPAREPLPTGWQGFTVYRVSGTSSTVTVPAGTDALIKCENGSGVPTAVTKRLHVNGGRNVIIYGCEVNINVAHASLDDRNAVTGGSNCAANGRFILMGSWLHGQYADDGFKGNCPTASWEMYDTLIGGSSGSDGLTSPPDASAADGVYHADCFQPYGGFTSARIDNVTCWSNYQGQMFKADAVGVAGTNHWRETWIGRYNMHHPTGTIYGKLINVVCGSDPLRCGSNSGPQQYIDGPLHFGSDLYIIPGSYPSTTGTLSSDITPASQFTFSGSGTSEVATPISPYKGLIMDGVIKEGTHPDGDYWPAGGCADCPGLLFPL